MTAPTISAGNMAHALVRAASRLISTPACGPIVNRSIRAQPGHLNRHASACGQALATLYRAATTGSDQGPVFKEHA
jgi:hypothetical protein